MREDKIYSADDLEDIISEFRSDNAKNKPAATGFNGSDTPSDYIKPKIAAPVQVPAPKIERPVQPAPAAPAHEAEKPVQPAPAVPIPKAAKPVRPTSASLPSKDAKPQPAEADSMKQPAPKSAERQNRESGRSDKTQWGELWKGVEHKPVKMKDKAEPYMLRAEPVPAAEDKPQKPNGLKTALFGLASLIFSIIAAVAILWVALNLHPASGTAISAVSQSKLDLSGKLDSYANNAASDALGDMTYIRKIYTIDESYTSAPAPDPSKFGSTYDPHVVMTDVIGRAGNLLEGQKVIFDPDADFVPDEPIQYYLDDTIMVVCWKEYIQERCCTCAEIKVAHGSQIRRKLANDSYSSNTQLYASDMAKQANAVVAINGDFYAFRELGITVYQRTLYRNNPATVDTCFFTADGDMLFSRAGELMGEGETQQFIDDNNVLFSVAFGPVLVDNGEFQYCSHYPIGEIDTEYSRAAIGMSDKLHYFLMTINHTMDARPRADINTFGRILTSKGLQKAYTLDGGQTSELVMDGVPVNHIDFGAERTMSDIIYFATALPEEEVG